jgi:hypothetical protein
MSEGDCRNSDVGFRMNISRHGAVLPFISEIYNLKSAILLLCSLKIPLTRLPLRSTLP